MGNERAASSRFPANDRTSASSMRTSASNNRASASSNRSSASNGRATLRSTNRRGSNLRASALPGSVEASATTTRKTLTFARTWDIFSYPPRNSYKGALLPKAINGRRRKITVEVHKVTTGPAIKVNAIKRVGNAIRQSMAITTTRRSASTDEDDFNNEEESANQKTSHFEECVIRLWRYVGDGDNVSTKDIDEAVDTVRGDDREEVEALEIVQSDIPGLFLPDIEGYKPKHWLPMKKIELKNIRKTRLTIHDKHMKLDREIGFESPEDCVAFVQLFHEEEAKEAHRINNKLRMYMSDQDLRYNNADEVLSLLIEIVSGWDIPIGDVSGTSDAFVICSINGKEVHRTQVIPKTLDPIWTLKTGSLFLLEVDSKELFTSDGLHCLLLDHDQVGAADKLGCITVPPDMLYKGRGDRMVFRIQPVMGGLNARKVKGCLAVRCRRATKYDQEFMKSYYIEQEAQERLGVGAAYDNINLLEGGRSNIKSIISKLKRIEKDGPNAGQKVYKIRPNPDPKRMKEETEWMTDQQIQDECLNDSHHWIESGSGKLGRLFVEILGCEDLPNMDTGGFLGNKTDTFVTVVYEDSVLRTDIIDDCLHPRWLPWTKRAFVFNMLHSSSELYIGILDHDVNDDHDFIGRVSIDIPNLRKDTVYLLKYGIFTTAKMSSRTRHGFVKVRIRIEIDDDRKFILSNLEPPPELYVNVKTRKDFRVVRATCVGKQDMESYHMNYINSHIEELLAYQHALFYIQDGLTALILWRGHYDIQLYGKKYNLPLHSLLAFVVSIVLIEKPQFWPSFFFLSVGWLLLAVMGYRRSQPDVWTHCKSYGEMANALILGDSMTPPDHIEQYQNYEESQVYLEYWKKRVAESEERAQAAFQETEDARAEYEKEMNEIGKATTDISTKQSNMSMDPFKPLLFPIQQNLSLLLQRLRYIRFVIFWEECYFSFWVTTACFVLSFAFLFVPWIFLLRWATRIFVWLIFGPWMKLVDILYFSENEAPTEEQLLIKKKANIIKRKLATSVAVEEARIKREDAAKLKAMKTFMFGKYITKVPVLKQDRYRDSPLPESTAVPYVAKPKTLAELAMREAGYRRTRLPGQHLAGDMIPRVAAIAFTDAPTGQPTLHPNLLDKNGPVGSLLVKGSDSTASAYVKLGSVFALASFFTWFSVPFLGLITEKVISWF